MRQYHNRREQTENSYMDDLGDMITGGKWRPIKGFVGMLINVNAMFLMLFLRKRMGTTLFSFGLWFWGGGWSLLWWTIELERYRHHASLGLEEEFISSLPLLWWHGQIFVWLLLAKWLIAVLSLRSERGLLFRDRRAIGNSEVYPLIYRLLKPLKLVGDHLERPRFWQLTEGKWLQFIEPALLLYGASQIRQLGYVTYANFLTIATCCLFIFTFQAYTNSAKLRQSERESDNLSQMM